MGWSFYKMVSIPNWNYDSRFGKDIGIFKRILKLKVGKDLGSLKDLYKTIFERILEIDLKGS